MEFVPASVAEVVLDREKAPRSWPAGKKAHEVFLDICAKWGWRTVDSRGMPTVEESVETLGELSMATESDFKFIQDYLVPRAVNANKQPFSFYVRHDAVHFHSDDFAKQIAAVYNFGRSMTGEVLSFAPSDVGFFSALAGGRKSYYVAIDAKEGTKIEQKTTDAGAPSGGRAPVAPDSQAFGDLGDAAKSRRTLVARDPVEFANEVAATVMRLRSMTYQATLDVIGTHALVPQDFVQVNYIMTNGRSHYLSGVFRAATVTHKIDSSGWVVSAELYRQGTKPPEANATKHEEGQTVTPQVNAQTAQPDQITTPAALGQVNRPGTVVRTVVATPGPSAVPGTVSSVNLVG